MPDGRDKKQHGVSRKLCVAQGCEQIQGEALQVSDRASTLPVSPAWRKCSGRTWESGRMSDKLDFPLESLQRKPFRMRLSGLGAERGVTSPACEGRTRPDGF